MTYITQLTGRSSVYRYRLLTMILAGCALLFLQSSAVQAQWSTGTNIYNTNSGNVGVGTSTPNQKLGVQGMFGLYPQAWVSPTQRGMFMFHDTAGGSIYAFNYPAGTADPINMSASNIGFHTYIGGSSYPRFSIANGGNVGIGITTPGELLHLRKDQNAVTRLMVENTTAGASAQADLQLKNNLGHFAQFGLYSSTTTTFGALASGNAYAYTTSPAMVMMANNATGIIKFATGGSSERMRIDASGKVGIGTAVPGYSLDVQANAQWVARFKKTDATNGGIIVDSAVGYNPNLALAVNGAIKWYMNSNVANSDSLQFWEATGAQPRLTITQAGSVGIGLPVPNSTYKLDVNGSTNVTGNLNVTATITGGTINAKYQDVAEWVQSSQQLSAGTVVVLDHTRSNQVIASSQAYDTRVAGVISLQPGIVLGENGAGKVLVATTGRVKVRVDATAGPIQVGDLLVTSDKEGVARKSEPLSLSGVQIHRPGTLIGKALEPLATGTGEILVLLSLQ